MLNILEAPKETSSFPKEGEGYGLSQILEKSTDVPKKYFLSANACRGIINRSERRNKVLPPILKKALEMQAGITHDEVSTTGGAERIRNRERTSEPTDDDGQSGNTELYARPDCYYATSCDGRSTIGSLCAHDGRGFNGQDVNQGKLIIQYESHNDN